MKSITRPMLVALSVGCAALAIAALGAQQPSVKARYEKREVMIPMRDGVKLFTIVYSPRDTSQTYPFLMTRTGYGIPPYGDEYRSVLGPNAVQAGSLNRPGYLRFDFNWQGPLSEQQRTQIEEVTNEAVQADFERSTVNGWGIVNAPLVRWFGPDQPSAALPADDTTSAVVVAL